MDDKSPRAETISQAEADSSAGPALPARLRGFSDYFKALGPGLIAGIADNDPSGVATYAITGAVTGFSLLWLMVLATFMVQAVQVSAARLGQATQSGLVRVAQQRYGSGFGSVVAVLILAANQATLIADVAALGAVCQLLTGIAWQWFVMPGSVIILLVVVLCNFPWLRNVFVVVGLLLLAYVVTAFLVRPNWSEALRATIVPSVPGSTVELSAAVALLGTTVSPYLVVWQTQGECEARRTRGQFHLAVVDITVGYIASNVLSYFIIVTTAATLFVHHQSIATAADVADALRPLAGDQARIIFAVGLLATAVLAIPIFAISNGYVVSEILDWPAGLSKSPREAPGFYGVLSVALLSGGAAALLGVDPILALFYSQILVGLLMAPVILVLGLLVNDWVVMGESRNTLYYNAWLVVSFVVMVTGATMLVLSLV